MTLIETIRSDLTEAMRSRDGLRLRTLRSVIAAVQEAETAGAKSELDDAGVQKIIAGQVKRRVEAAEAFEEGDRPEKAADERAEIEILETYLPERLSDGELQALVEAVLAAGGLTEKSQMGTAMKAVNAQVAGRADGRAVADAVMDGDLQDPPEDLPRLLAVARQGSPIVIARRRPGTPQAAWRRLASGVFASLITRRNKGRLPRGYSFFSILSPTALDAYLERGERFDVYAEVLSDLGLGIASVDYDKVERPEGRSAYTPARLVRLAYRGLFPRRGAARAPVPVASERIPAEVT